MATRLAVAMTVACRVDGVTAVTNDAGLVTLADGSHLVLAIFVKDSADAPALCDEVIARMARAAYDCWTERR